MKNIIGPKQEWLEFNGEDISELYQKTNTALSKGSISNRAPSYPLVETYHDQMRRDKFDWFAQSTPLLLDKDGIVRGGWHRILAAHRFCEGDTNKIAIFPVVKDATDNMVRQQDLNRKRTITDNVVINSGISFVYYKPLLTAGVVSAMKIIWAYKENADAQSPTNSCTEIEAEETLKQYDTNIRAFAQHCLSAGGGRKDTNKFWKKAVMVAPFVFAWDKMTNDKYYTCIENVVRHTYESDAPEAKLANLAVSVRHDASGAALAFFETLRILYAVEKEKTLKSVKDVSNSEVETFFGLI